MSLQDQINEELKGVKITDPLTPEQRAYFCTLETDEEMDAYLDKVLRKSN